MSRLHRIPPAPQVLSFLYNEFLREGRGQGLSFHQYLEFLGCVDKAVHHHGMDDSASFRMAPARGGPELISIPRHALTGELRAIVLMVDFDDRVGSLPASHYEELLFSKGTHPTGSMRDYFDEVSLGQVDVTGTVHGWLRMPQTYDFYTNGYSGTGPADGTSVYPRDARRLAEDAVRTALDHGIPFDPELDMFGDGVITAFFIVHAGVGAEVQRNLALRNDNIWSHKWSMVNPVDVGPTLTATTYLVVPNDCDLGVCAHELGHLAFQWEDFYDPNGSEDGQEWDGSGDWDLMAGGSYNGDSRSPAHPVALHKAQHGWIEVDELTGPGQIRLPAFTATSARAARIASPRYQPGQYLMLEHRTSFGFDAELPGEGLLVWRVDESREMFAPQRPALLLIQADGRHHLESLESPSRWNSGDTGDPFPGSSGRTELGDSGDLSTSFPNGHASGIELRNIHRDPATGEMVVDVVFDGVAPPVEPPQPDDARVIRQEVAPNLAIPDNDPDGIRSRISIDAGGGVRDIAVEVQIAHTYIGDLTVDLIAPSGQRARLHDHEGGSKHDIRRVYRAVEHAEVQALVDGPIEGDWTLQIVDHADRDTGVLEKWGLAIIPEAETTPGIVREERKPSLPIPDNDPNGIASTARIGRAGLARSLEVEVDISHTYRRDLRVELVAPTGERALLHNRAGGSEDDLRAIYHSRDTAALAAFVGKPVRGDWTLRVADLEGADTGTLNLWRLEMGLAPRVHVAELAAGPDLAIPDNDPQGVGSVLDFTEEGTVQSIEANVEIRHSYVGDLRVELVAPSGERAMLFATPGTRRRDLSLALRSSSSPVLAPLVGLPLNGSWILRVTDFAARDVGRLASWSLKLEYVD